MMIGISIFSFAIAARRDLSSARSGDPGVYDFVGSLTAVGTRRTPAKAASSLTGALVAGAVEGFSAGAVGAGVDIRVFYSRGWRSGEKIGNREVGNRKSEI